MKDLKIEVAREVLTKGNLEVQIPLPIPTIDKDGNVCDLFILLVEYKNDFFLLSAIEKGNKLFLAKNPSSNSWGEKLSEDKMIQLMWELMIVAAQSEESENKNISTLNPISLN